MITVCKLIIKKKGFNDSERNVPNALSEGFYTFSAGLTDSLSFFLFWLLIPENNISFKNYYSHCLVFIVHFILKESK